ncbi:GNAT family N-acetyltransferase [Nocardioides sp. YIM 152315]|uniref:GNAT family N-acetyltransferase n=1 Tax=Nocardioides sp. YIM 152315 TaxID=3031760 RepID=UPI0023DC5314|nr:GNAT family N-acetyltransferase [Nocardioides sp. YIM 152315]MDF1602894.1 GNAT family N-acetyltransferase [Nocardioides sp. YIM 152315]
MSVRRCHTGELSPRDLAESRELCAGSFRDFTDADWSHALGGTHALVHEDGRLVAHGSLVLRRLMVDGRWLRCGYVEAVAVADDVRRRGRGSAVMESLEELAPGYDLLALSASDAGAPFYEARGWDRWRGPSSVATTVGVVPTPDDDGAIYARGERLDLDAPITCDWREGDVW